MDTKWTPNIIIQFTDYELSRANADVRLLVVGSFLLRCLGSVKNDNSSGPSLEPIHDSGIGFLSAPRQRRPYLFGRLGSTDVLSICLD